MGEAAPLICPTCEEGPRTFRGEIRVGLVQVLAEEHARLEHDRDCYRARLADLLAAVASGDDQRITRARDGARTILKHGAPPMPPIGTVE